jgi:flagellar hook-associated protein 1 FlgK
MSLFSTMRMSAGALQAAEIGLQVVGQNIANANTPSYIREEVVYTPAAASRYGNLLLGNGVQVEAVIQKIDLFLEERLRGAISDQASAETEESAYSQLESLIDVLGDTSIGAYLQDFASAISGVLNDPESVSTRNMAVLQATSVTEAINDLGSSVYQMRVDVNDQVIATADTINELITKIADLNVKIANTEGGNVTDSDAVGLRDQRLAALRDLSELIDIKVTEQPSGSVVVYSGGTYLVYEGETRSVKAVIESESGFPSADIRVVETGESLNPTSGELAGLFYVRDEVLGGFADNLDEFTNTLIYEFNKVYSSGQGLTGYTEVTSEFSVLDASAALNAAGLEFTPTNGSFQIITTDGSTGLTKTYDITVDLNGIGEETSLYDIVDQINKIPGLTARVNSKNQLEIKAESGQSFAFANDTSGALAALGVNTFFSGTNASTISVNSVVLNDPSKFAASQGGVGVDTENGVVLANFLNLPLASANGATLTVLYDRLTAAVTQASAIATSTAESSRVFTETLQAEKSAISGVSLDEEAVQMLAYQQAFQAAARVISVISELMEVLVNI